MSEAIVLQPKEMPQEIQKWESPRALKARITAIQDLMRQALKEGVDYGRIPGMPSDAKPCLLKPGSEQILAMFRIAVDPVVEDLSTDDCYRYRVTTRLTDVGSGVFLGAGLGECSSNETKYKWRRTYSQKEFDVADKEGRARIKYGQRRDGSGYVEYEEKQVRQEAADVANTILKMAKKRSQIDGTLTVTGASSMFEQDLLDDLPEEAQEQTQKRGRGRPKSQAKVVEDVMCSDCHAINGHLPSCKYHESNKQTQAKAPATEKVQEQPAQDKPAAPQPAEFGCIVKSVEKKTYREQKGEYYTLGVIDMENHEEWIYCFHLNAGKEIADKAIGKACRFILESRTRRDGTKFRQVEKIIEIAGVMYQDGKPVVNSSPEEW